MKLVFGMLLLVVVASVLGCGGAPACSLDKNGDGQLTEADFLDLTQEQQDALFAQFTSDPLSFLPCLSMIQSAMGTLPGLAQ